jgi:hypothetical protein
MDGGKLNRLGRPQHPNIIVAQVDFDPDACYGGAASSERIVTEVGAFGIPSPVTQGSPRQEFTRHLRFFVGQSCSGPEGPGCENVAINAGR